MLVYAPHNAVLVTRISHIACCRSARVSHCVAEGLVLHWWLLPATQQWVACISFVLMLRHLCAHLLYTPAVVDRIAAAPGRHCPCHHLSVFMFSANDLRNLTADGQTGVVAICGGFASGAAIMCVGLDFVLHAAVVAPSPYPSLPHPVELALGALCRYLCTQPDASDGSGQMFWCRTAVCCERCVQPALAVPAVCTSCSCITCVSALLAR